MATKQKPIPVRTIGSSHSEGYTRLHITPFSQSLLETIVPTSILPNAKNISFHSIETFPEKSYGFIELPETDANRLKKDRHGTILKGSKIKIEAATPMAHLDVTEAAEPTRKKVKKDTKDSSKKRKRDDETLPGADIGPRKVKRGWTEPASITKKTDKKSSKASTSKKDKKLTIKSKFISGPECLFKTVLPPNIAIKAETTTPKIKRDGRKSAKPGKETLVHEFAKTTRFATFLRLNSDLNQEKRSVEFMEGKGWIDQDGNVLEEVILKSKRTAPVAVETLARLDLESQDVDMDGEHDTEASETLENGPSNAHIPAQTTLSPTIAAANDLSAESEEIIQSSETSHDDDSTASERSGSQLEAYNKPETLKNIIQRESSVSSQSTNSSSSDEDSSSEENSDSGESEPKEGSPEGKFASGPTSDHKDKLNQDSSTASQLMSTKADKKLSIKVPSTNTDPHSGPVVVHPLEALYKKSKSDGNIDQTPSAAPFSFFGVDANEEVEDTVPIPMTPFTKMDFESRGLRSAAPTPDAGHAHRRFNWPSEGKFEDNEGNATTSKAPNSLKNNTRATPEEAVSDFQKWFYDNRGDANRAWKKRRKIVSKEKRQRENRKRPDHGQ